MTRRAVDPDPYSLFPSGELRRTAGSGSARNGCGSTSLQQTEVLRWRTTKIRSFWTFSFQVYLFLQVNKSSLEFVRFEAEIENYGSMENVLAKLDMRTIKLSGQDPRLFFYLKAPKCNWMNNIKWQLWIKEREKILVFSEIISLFDLLNINLQKYRYYWVSFNQIRYSYFFVQFILWLDQFVKYYLYGGFSNVYFS